MQCSHLSEEGGLISAKLAVLTDGEVGKFEIAAQGLSDTAEQVSLEVRFFVISLHGYFRSTMTEVLKSFLF